MGKFKEALKTVLEYGMYYHDNNLVEAIVRSLTGLALISIQEIPKWDDLSCSIKEYLKSQILYKESCSHHGQAICCLAIG
jgi:hypothetical protein